MKKSYILLTFLFTIILLVCSCGQKNNTTSPESEIQKIEYQDGQIVEIRADVNTVSVSGELGSKDVYLVKTNPTKEYIKSPDNSRYAKSVSNNIKLNAFNSDRQIEQQSILPDILGKHSSCFNCNHPKQDFNKNFFARSEEAERTHTPQNIDRTNSQLELVPGVTKKELWCLFIEENPIKKSATLRACNNICNIWVVDEFWSDGEVNADEGKVNKEFVEKVEACIEDIYVLEETLYGPLFNKIFYPNTDTDSGNEWELKDIKCLDDTNGKMNIVLCMLDPEIKVMGFFSPNDYFPNLEDFNLLTGESYDIDDYEYYSNEGNYFYANSSDSVREFSDFLTTACHELQHLFMFNRKIIQNYNATGVSDITEVCIWEMMAVLHEDFMISYFENHFASEDYDITYSPIGSYIPPFNQKYYYRSGLEYIEFDSYPMLYAFIAWFARNYGGAELANYIANSQELDFESAIIKGAKEIAGKTVTIESLLRDFSYACITKKDNFGFRKGVPAHTSGDYHCAGNNYGFPLIPINLHNLQEMGVDKDWGVGGPYFNYYDGLPNVEGGLGVAVRPYGIEMDRVGTIDEGAREITIELTENTSPGLKTYLVIE